MISVGKHTGGRLRSYPDDKVNTNVLIQDPHYKPVFFNGQTLHETEPFEGNRISIIFFKSRLVERMDEDAWAELRHHGFRPIQKRVNTLSMMRESSVVVSAMNVTRNEEEEVPLTKATLAAAPIQEQKTMIHARLLPAVRRIEPQRAEQIANELMKKDNDELLLLLTSTAQLETKVKEATQVLSGGSELSTSGVAAALAENGGAGGKWTQPKEYMVGSVDMVDQEMKDEQMYNFGGVDEEYDLLKYVDDEPGATTVDARIVDKSTGEEKEGWLKATAAELASFEEKGLTEECARHDIYE